MRNILVTLVATAISISTFAQDTITAKPKFTWSIFADVYYSYDLNKPKNHKKAFFLYNHNRHNEVNLNLGLIQANYENSNVRSTIGLQAGTYPEYNYASEQGLLKNVFQANIGVKLLAKTSLWLDAGILPSHIGYESALSKNNWSLTRSIMAENSPYYEAGAKLTYTTKNEKWQLSGLLLNGWQWIRRVDDNNTPAFGTQLTYTPSGNATFNWSTFVGNDYPDSLRKWRYFNNLYAVFKLSEKFGITLGFDIGLEQKAKGSRTLNMWYTPNIVLYYTLTAQWLIAARAEYYDDANGVIIGTGTPNGFKTKGASLNLDRKVTDNFWWRTEIRTLNSRDAIFKKKEKATNGNTFLTTSFCITL